MARSITSLGRSLTAWTLMVLIYSVALEAGAITGTVQNTLTDKPIPGALISILQTGATATSDSLGGYHFDSVPPGSYHLLFSAESYDPLLRNDVYVTASSVVKVDAALVPPGSNIVDKMTVTASSFARAPDMTASSKIMNFDELLRAPGAMMDAQRAVQSMPGVASGADNLNEIIVRGGTPGENLFIMDGIEISNPNHFATQGSGGGVISLVNPLLVKGLVFNAGAPPAQYGGKASSVLDITLRDGNDKMILGGVDIGVRGLGGHAEGPLWPGATFMASGTRSFLDLVAQFERTTAIPDYWGAQVKLRQKTPMGSITTNGVMGRSRIEIPFANRDVGTRGQDISSGGDVFAAGIRAARSIGESITSTLTLSSSHNSFLQKEFTPEGETSSETVYYRNLSRESEQTLKAELGIDIAHGIRLLVGGHLRRADFNIDISEVIDTLKLYRDDPRGEIVTENGVPITTPRFEPTRERGYKYGGYISGVVPWERLRMAPGVRVDGFDYNKSLTVSPRINAAYRLIDNLELTSAFGVQYQDPSYAELAISPSNRNLKPFRALTGVGGLEYTIPAIDARVTLESYYKGYSDLPVDSSLLRGGEQSRYAAATSLVSEGNGMSYGVELYLQKKLTKHFSGSAAYSYSRSWREDVRPGHLGEWYPSDFDFRNNLALTAGYKHELLDSKWYHDLSNRLWFRLLSPLSPIADRMELSVQWRYLGGRPFTEKQYVEDNRIWVVPSDVLLNRSRYPAYHRLDVRFERRFAFGFLHLIYYFDLQNVYSRVNVWQFLYIDGKSTKSTIYQIPFFPAGGIIVGF